MKRSPARRGARGVRGRGGTCPISPEAATDFPAFGTNSRDGMDTMVTRPAARVPVKLHKHVTLLRTVEPLLAEELLARKSLARWVVGRLSETVLLVQPEESEAVLEELRRIGHTPRVVR